MIKDVIKIHDKFSLEIKLLYDVSIKKRKAKYNVSTYLFIPNGLNINKQNYTKEKFYNDVKVNIRYHSPKYKLIDFVNEETNLISKLQQIIKEEITLNSKKISNNFNLQTKLFGSVFKGAIKAEYRTHRNKISSNSINELNTVNSLVKKILDEYRATLKVYEPKLNSNAFQVLLFVDEYISNIVEFNLFLLHEYLEKKKTNIDKEIFSSIVSFIDDEQKYREQKQFRTVPVLNSTNEELLHVRGQLKKYIDSILFLKKEVRKDGAIAEQTFFALAAGLAMLFSTGIAFYFQQKYGNFTTPFFVALVISYMLKDRIKSIFGWLFINQSGNIFYDYKLKIYSSEKTRIGTIKENFSFIPLDKLERKIKKFRLTNRFFKKDYTVFKEQVIKYKKKVTVSKKKFKKGIDEEKIKKLADITRINFSRLTKQMDDPKKTYIIIENGKIIKKQGERVYKINIIQKFKTENGNEYKRFRVILNRDGIKRIEKIHIEKP